MRVPWGGANDSFTGSICGCCIVVQSTAVQRCLLLCTAHINNCLLDYAALYNNLIWSSWAAATGTLYPTGGPEERRVDILLLATVVLWS